jgi:hypothetical protein
MGRNIPKLAAKQSFSQLNAHDGPLGVTNRVKAIAGTFSSPGWSSTSFFLATACNHRFFFECVGYPTDKTVRGARE